MSKKQSELSRNKEVSASYEPQDDSELEGEAGDDWFPYDTTAYGVAKNEKGYFDLLVIRVNTKTDKAEVEREATNYDSVQRAILDIQIRTEQELTKRKK